MNPVTPAEVPVEEFLRPLGMSWAALARGLGVPACRISGIVHGRRGISADTAVRLGLFFGTTPRLWPNLQADHDLALAQDALSPEDAARSSPAGSPDRPRRQGPDALRPTPPPAAFP